ncbi:MAG: hypothetical protein HON56_05720 [Nitrospina sp.]|nr:hypothetical protein [Nitrospina sp.]
MKNIKQLILFALIGMLYFAPTASGDITQADATRFSSRIAISPYAQAVPNDSYTFIGVSHPSLSTALTQIGVVVEAIGMTTTTNNAAGRAAVFTVDAGETHRVFIVNQSNATINTSNASFTDSRTHLIPTVDSAQFGAVRVTSVSERPQEVAGSREVDVGGVKKFDNLAQLSIWGIVFIESGGAGFAMEFIGDMQDSTLGGSLTSGVGSNLGNSSTSSSNSPLTRPARGIN